MSIKIKITLFYIASVLAFFAVWFYGSQTHKAHMNKSLEMGEYYSDLEVRALKTQVHFKKQVQEWKNILLRGTEAGLFDKYAGQFFDEERRTNFYINSLIERLETGSPGYAKANEFLEAHSALGERYREALPAYHLAEYDPHITVDKYVRGADRRPTDLIDELIALIQQRKQVIRENIRSDLAAETQRQIWISMLLIACLFAILLTLLNRIVVNPVLSATRIASNVASGRFSNPITYGTLKDEVNRLLYALNTMQQKLSEYSLDISRKKRELQAALDESRESDRLKTEFLTNLNHEFNTPMNGVMGMLALLSDTRLSAEQQEYVNVAKDSSKRLMQTVQSVLDLSDIQKRRFVLESELFDLPECLTQVCKNGRQLAGKSNLEFTSSISSDLPRQVYGDRQRLTDVLMTLIGNAVKFTSHGGVAMAVDVLALDDSEVLLRFEVSDTGIGIASDKLGVIFDSFTQEDGSISRQHEGLGVGLALCSYVIRMMGGEISVQSETNRGSVFTFNIPLEYLAERG